MFRHIKRNEAWCNFSFWAFLGSPLKNLENEKKILYLEIILVGVLFHWLRASFVNMKAVSFAQ